MQIEGVLDDFKPAWSYKAACSDLPWTMFFSDDGTRKERYLPGIAVCWESCRVREKCLEDALDKNTKAGIWGGFTTAQRREMRKQRQREAS